MDRDTSDVPELTDAVVSQSPHGLAVKVLPAQDVDLRGFESDEVIPPAKVQVDVLIGDRPRSEVLLSGMMDVPSGVPGLAHLCAIGFRYLRQFRMAAAHAIRGR